MAVAIHGDCTELAQKLFGDVLRSAKSENPEERAAAHYWLTFEDNRLRDLILEATAPDIHLDWLRSYVRKIQEDFDGRAPQAG